MPPPAVVGPTGPEADKRPAKTPLTLGVSSIWADTLRSGRGSSMSFRTRLTSFFVLIVVIPMLAVGFLVFRLIGDSQQGKADARANGVATAAASLYQSESLAARGDAQTIARAVGGTATGQLRGNVSAL